MSIIPPIEKAPLVSAKAKEALHQGALKAAQWTGFGMFAMGGLGAWIYLIRGGQGIAEWAMFGSIQAFGLAQVALVRTFSSRYNGTNPAETSRYNGTNGCLGCELSDHDRFPCTAAGGIKEAKE